MNQTLPIMLRLSALFLALLCLCQCGGGTPLPSPRLFETPAAEALLRHLAKTHPFQADAKVACVVVGDQQMETSAAFQERFTDLGLKLLAHGDVSWTHLANTTRMVTKEHGPTGRDLVLLLQVSALDRTAEGYEAVGAWSFRDDMVRQRFTLKDKPDGSFTITPGEVLAKKPEAGSPTVSP